MYPVSWSLSLLYPTMANETVHADVVIVGSGVAGATAAHAIALASPSERVLVLERGMSGRGDEDKGRASGTAVFRESEGPTAVKMMVGLYAATSREFLREHSLEDAQTWFKMTSLGLTQQKEKAMELLPAPDKQFHQKGSIMVAPPEDEQGLEQEFEFLLKAGCHVEKMEKSEVVAATGYASGFTEGIYFPDDAIIDSSAYAQCLLREAERRGRVTVREGCAPVINIVDKGGSDCDLATVRLSSGEVIQAEHVVVATGAFFHGGPLAGLLKPCYSYLVAMPHTHPSKSFDKGMEFPTSPNIFTFGFSHDWCMVDGICRMSGEDHFSALKPPHTKERCRRLAEWTYRRFPQLDRNAPFTGRHGVYSETPDLLPIFSKTTAESRICYLVGCNAWGQALMSCLGYMVPAVLGYRPYEPDEEQIENLCSIRRFPVACYQMTGSHEPVRERIDPLE